jgi:hypothetical protein
MNSLGKITVKGATWVSGHSLNCIFACLKYHKRNIIIWIVIIFWEYFPLIENFTCSKLDTNKLKKLHVQSTQTLKMNNPCFLKKMFFFLPNVHHSFWKLERILTLKIKREKGFELINTIFITHLVQKCFWPWKLWILKMWF